MRKALCVSCVWITICVLPCDLEGEEPKKKVSRASLSKGEKAELQRIRKVLATCKKTAQRDYDCRSCKGSGEQVVAVNGSNKGLKGQHGKPCDLCNGYGLGMTFEFFSALNTYYGEVARCPENLRPFIEDAPTLGRWILNKIKGPELAAALNEHWKGSGTKTETGSASILAVRIVGAYRNADPKWSICVGETLEGPRGFPHLVLLVTRGDYLPFTGAQEATGEGRLLLVAYSEGGGAYRDLLNDSRAALDRRRAESISKDVAKEKDEALSRLQKTVNYLNGTKVILTVSDAIVCPPRFYRK